MTMNLSTCCGLEKTSTVLLKNEVSIEQSMFLA